MTSQDLDTPFGSINIYLQSRDALQSIGTNNANKIWYLNTPVAIPRPDVKMLCAVTDFQAAYSWYIIRTGVNDKFAFSDQSGLSVPQSVTIPEGNYSSTTFMNKLNTLLTGTRISYDVSTNKFIYTSAVPTNTVTIFGKGQGTGDGSTCDTEIGLENVSSVTGVGSCVFPNMCNFAGIPYIYVVAKTLSLENRNSLGDINLTLCKVPVTVQPLGFIYLPETAGSVFLTLEDREIKKIQIVLEDDEGNELNFHGIGWGLTLTIHFQYARMPQGNSQMILDQLSNQTKEPKNHLNTHQG